MQQSRALLHVGVVSPLGSLHKIVPGPALTDVWLQCVEFALAMAKPWFVGFV